MQSSGTWVMFKLCAILISMSMYNDLLKTDDG